MRPCGALRTVKWPTYLPSQQQCMLPPTAHSYLFRIEAGVRARGEPREAGRKVRVVELSAVIVRVVLHVKRDSPGFKFKIQILKGRALWVLLLFTRGVVQWRQVTGDGA